MWILILLFSSVSAETSCQETLIFDTMCPIDFQTTISIIPAIENPVECQKQCSSLDECSHFTLYTLTDPKVTSCALLRSCNTAHAISCSGKPDSVISTCDSAISGPKTPAIADVCCSEFKNSACQGEIHSQKFDVSSPNECQTLCSKTKGCNYFTQYGADLCMLYNSCEKTETCSICTSGPRSPSLDQCKEQTTGMTLLIGGTTSTQGSYSTNMELVTKHLSCTPLMPEPPIASRFSSAALMGSTIMYCGGYINIAPSYNRECYSYSLSKPGATWEQAASMNHGRDKFTMDVSHGKLIAVGGRSDWGNSVTGKTVEVYTPEEGWKVDDQMQMPTYRYEHCSAMIDDRLIIIGGQVDGTSYSSHVIQFDLSSPTQGWRYLKSTNNGHQMHACQVGLFQNQRGVYVAGGSNKGHNIVEFYVESVNRWQTLPALTSDRYYHSASLLAGKLFLHGGYPSTARGTQEIFDKTWKSGVNLRVSRYYHATVSVPEDSIECNMG